MTFNHAIIDRKLTFPLFTFFALEFLGFVLSYLLDVFKNWRRSFVRSHFLCDDAPRTKWLQKSELGPTQVSPLCKPTSAERTRCIRKRRPSANSSAWADCSKSSKLRGVSGDKLGASLPNHAGRRNRCNHFQFFNLFLIFLFSPSPSLQQ